MPFGGVIFWLLTTGLFPIIAIVTGLGALYAWRTDRRTAARVLVFVAALALIAAVAEYLVFRLYPP